MKSNRPPLRDSQEDASEAPAKCRPETWPEVCLGYLSRQLVPGCAHRNETW